jgi:hypothetical protein
VLVVTTTYRVRYSLKASGQPHSAADVLTADLQADLEQIPGLLPPGAYIMYIEDLAAGRNVHWARWPKSYRPGFGG